MEITNFFKLILVLLLVFFSLLILPNFITEDLEITINEKERVTVGHGESIRSTYLIYSESEVFENSDNWLRLKFNSSDFQNQLKKGNTYQVKVIGWRIPFLSMYRNIVVIY